ncbi:MAG TPA: DUF2316 family protein [Isoptericola sp.]|nr:DUF2316 family protein [Isoptericola sp.]
MSLNIIQIRRTRTELKENFHRSGLTPDAIQADLGFSAERLDQALRLRRGTTGPDIWLLRDYLEQAVTDAGAEPVPYTVLTEESRSKARQWFDLLPAPRHDFSGGSRE